MIGLGGMGALHASILGALPHTKIAGFADTDKRLVSIARRLLPKIPIFTDSEELVDSGIDAAFVCTPFPTHYQLVTSLLNQRKVSAIFVEKPLATTLPEAIKLADTAKEGRVTTMIGHQKRFAGTFRRSKQYLDAGVLGKPLFFRAHHFTTGVMDRKSGWKYEAPLGGVTLDWGTHSIDLLASYFGEPISLRARRKAVFSSNAEDYFEIQMDFPGGTSGTLTVSWSTRGYSPPELKISIHGTTGALEANEDRLTVHSDKDVPGILSAGVHVFHASELNPSIPFLIGQPENVLQDQSFVECIMSGGKPTNDFQSGVVVHRIIDTIKQSQLELP